MTTSVVGVVSSGDEVFELLLVEAKL